MLDISDDDNGDGDGDNDGDDNGDRGVFRLIATKY